MIKNIIEHLKTNKRYKVALSTFNILVLGLLIAFSSYVYGWFAFNSETYANEMGVAVMCDENSINPISIYALKYDGIDGAVAIPINDEKVEIQMSEYDCIFVDRNVNSPLIIRVEAEGFTNDQEDIVVKIPCLSKYTTNEGMSLDTSEGSTDKISDFLSNVLVIKLGCTLKIDGEYVRDSYDIEVEENVKTIFEGARDSLRESEITGRFVTNQTKVDTIELTLTPSDYQDCIVDGKLVFFVELDYSDELINDFLTYSDDSEETEFKNDLGTIILK